MNYLHTMIRVENLEQALEFYVNKLGLIEVDRHEEEKGRYTNVFLRAPDDHVDMEHKRSPLLELTFNWDAEKYTGGRNFGHLAYAVDNIYNYCWRLMEKGVVINRPPRDGHMAFIRSPEGISIELLQIGDALPPQEPWSSMQNTGEW